MFVGMQKTILRLTLAFSVTGTLLCSALSGQDCDPSTTNLLDKEVWRREAGYWVGNYTFLGSSGAPFAAAAWPYPYQPYSGVIHIKIEGSHLRQRNIFLYPPLPVEECAAMAAKNQPNVKGQGVCGVNGNEKIFSADQDASDCDGNLAGPFPSNGLILDTYTTVMGDDTVIYQVRYRETELSLPGLKLSLKAGQFNQNQLTTLPGNDTRVRTAQSFNFDGTPQAASFYREVRVADQAAFVFKLAALRAAYNILPSDYCGWDSGNAPSKTTCTEHFGFPVP